MLQPHEFTKELPVKLSNGVLSSTTLVWQMLAAAKNGDLAQVKTLAASCPELIYAQYNYTPPIHFAVREGHTEMVHYLLEQGAHDPSYKIYPFGESLQTLADDRGFAEIKTALDRYAADPSGQKYKGDNGEILFGRNEIQEAFQKAVYEEDLQKTAEIVEQHPEFAMDPDYFWGEGILLFAAKAHHLPMIELLTSYGATVPSLLKWAQFYYFERLDGAATMMKKGMSANTMSWHHVTLLHDMAQKGALEKAKLLIQYGADINAIDEEYQSTPLGMAASWGHTEMVNYLLEQGADPNKSGASWSTPIAWAGKKGHAEVERVLLDKGGLC